MSQTALILFTCGLYLPVFLIVAVVQAIDHSVRGGYLCTRCGKTVR